MESSSKENKVSKKGENNKLKSRNMPGIQRKQRLIAICVLFFCLLNFPILTIFNVNKYIGGIPILYIYFIAIWLIMIAAIMFIIEKRDKDGIDEI